MTTTINASTSNGLVQTADGSGIIKVQSNGVTTNALAWVNFAGASGTRNANYNVSSVTRSATGTYTINFATTLSDANYCVSASAGDSSTDARICTVFSLSTASCIIYVRTVGNVLFDATTVSVSIFGN